MTNDDAAKALWYATRLASAPEWDDLSSVMQNDLRADAAETRAA